MSILWDAPLTASVARELEEELVGARLRALHLDRTSRSLLLHFRRSTLIFRLHPLRGDVALLGPREAAPEARTLKAELRGVHAPPDERLLLFQLQPGGGSAEPQGVVVELMTNQWNALWIDVSGGRIRRVLWPREAGRRVLLPGEAYRRPPASERRGIEEPLSEEEWRELLGGEPPKERRRTLLRTVAFTSSLVAPSLLASVPDDPEASMAAGHGLWLRLRRVALGQAGTEPVLLRRDGEPQPYPVPLPGEEGRPCGSLLEGFIRAIREAGDESAAAALLPGALLERLQDALTEAERKSDRLEEELLGTPDPDELRRIGDLILARFDQVPRGGDRAILEGFDGDPVEVELDPSLAPDGNARSYYDRAARAERARDRLPELIEAARKRTRELGGLQERVRAGEAEAAEVREALPSPSDGGSAESRGERLPYRRYRSSGGLEIRVGRGARENDELTFHHSAPDDVWLHARQVPGAHVILRWSREGSPPSRDLGEAATLAALHSDARHSTSVPVDWTRRKYVRSPRKAPPGLVVPERVRTVFVEPDPALEKRLREK